MNSPSFIVAKAELLDSSAISILPANSHPPSAQTLFESKFIALVLVKLRRGQRLHFEESMLRLLTVAQGKLRLRGPNGSFVLHAHGHWRLERGEQWKIRASTDANVSLLIVKIAH